MRCEMLRAVGTCGDGGLAAAREVVAAASGAEPVMAGLGVALVAVVGYTSSLTRAGDPR